MTLYLARDDGSGTVLTELGFGHLLEIAKLDVGLGENDVAADPKGVEVTYAQSETGVCPDRLNALANSVGFTSPPDIIIFPVGGSFMLSDGTAITSVAGVALPVGNALNPTTGDVVTIYDTSQCTGSGYWVDKEGGGTTGFPSTAIIFHELSHCFHFVTGTTAATGAAEEVAAENDENLVRDQLGIDHRNAASHTGGCGGGPTGCCVVATVSSGSPYSTEVNRLRIFRDHFLRRGRVGHDFFDRLHYDYYAFSPEVLRAMSHSKALHRTVRDNFVNPLLAGLAVVTQYSSSGADALAVGREIKEQVPMASSPNGFAALDTNDDRGDPLAWATKAAASPHVCWALVEVIALWDEISSHADELDAEALGRRAIAAIERWAPDIPLSPVWSNLNSAEAVTALAELDVLLLTDESRQRFGQRLADHEPSLDAVISGWIRRPEAIGGAR
jgi:hypothetical protein